MAEAFPQVSLCFIMCGWARRLTALAVYYMQRVRLPLGLLVPEGPRGMYRNRIESREQRYTHISGRATVAVYVCFSCIRQI